MFPLIWDLNPEIMKIGGLSIRYYSLLFGLGFFFGKKIFSFFLKKENKNDFNLDSLVLYMILGTTIGARVGHCIFHQWDYFSTRPWEIFLPFKFYPEFKFTGFSGLASHGATIGILFSMYIFSKWTIKVDIFEGFFSIKKNENKISYFWLMDRVCICTALGGFFIRMGNFANSELYGIPTEKNGAIFVSNTVENIKSLGPFIVDVDIKKIEEKKGSYQPIVFCIKFSKKVEKEDLLKKFIERDLKETIFDKKYSDSDNIKKYEDNFSYILEKKEGNYIAKIKAIGIIRHISQIYEAFVCLLVFLLFFGIWYFSKFFPYEGILTGIFMTIIFSARIAQEYFKCYDVIFKIGNISFTKPQILSIPAVLIGILFIFYSLIKKIK